MGRINNFLKRGILKARPTKCFSRCIRVAIRLKKEILYLDSPFHGNDNFNGNSEAKPSENSFRIKKGFFNKLNASSLTEVLVATTILVVVFVISLGTLNNMMMSTVKKETHVLETKIEKMSYQYKNKQLKIPVSYTEDEFSFSIEKIVQNDMQFIEFTITNSTSKKTLSKKQFFDKTE